MPEYSRRGYFRVDLSNNCNIRCIMCQAYNSLPVSAMEFLDFERFKESTQGELRRWQTIQLGNVAEATVHPRFADYLRYIRSEAPDSTIHLVTNGRLLHRFAPLINEVGNCLVQISMDSVKKDVHEYIRAGSDYARALANIEMLDRERTRVLLSFTLMRSNIEEYSGMVAFCQSRGYHMSAFPMIARTENGILPFNLLKESLWFSRDHLRSWLKEHYGGQYELMVGTASGALQRVNEFTCNAHYDDLNLDAAGNVNLCGKLVLGSLKSTDLRTVWNGQLAEGFRLQVETDRGPCMTCDYRQRCLSPSMASIDNHFSEEIAGILSPSTRHLIRYDREISDDEARWLLVRDLGLNVGVFDITQVGKRWEARSIVAGDSIGEYKRGSPIVAESRHELHGLMLRVSNPGLTIELLQAFGAYNLVAYQRKVWALPTVLGVINLTNEADRSKPGILTANTLDELKELCGITKGTPLPPSLVGHSNGYNLVNYDAQYWGIPVSLGPFDLTNPENRVRPEVLIAKTLPELERLCHPALAELNSGANPKQRFSR